MSSTLLVFIPNCRAPHITRFIAILRFSNLQADVILSCFDELDVSRFEQDISVYCTVASHVSLRTTEHDSIMFRTNYLRISASYLSSLILFAITRMCLKKNQNAPRPSEHPRVRGKKCQNVLLFFVVFRCFPLSSCRFRSVFVFLLSFELCRYVPLIFSCPADHVCI